MVVELPEIILGNAMLEILLSVNVSELLYTLVGCSIWERMKWDKSESKNSLAGGCIS